MKSERKPTWPCRGFICALGVLLWGGLAQAAPQVEALPNALAVPVLPIIIDPVEDHVTTPGNPIVDIIAVRGGADGTSMTLKVNFSSDTVMNQVVGYIDLDTDQNQATGITPIANELPGTTQDLGVDYFLDLFSMPSVYVWKGNPIGVVGIVTATTVGRTIEITVPLSMLGNDNGAMNVGILLGNSAAAQATDAAPNSLHGTIQVVPPVVCRNTLNKTTLVTGDSIIVQSLQVANPGSTALPIEYKLWVDLPGGGTHSWMRGGADSSVSLAAGASTPDALGGPQTLTDVISTFPPRGSYSINCLLEDPVTGTDFVVHTTPFVVQ